MSYGKVYLCGPITGLSYEEARHGWRSKMRKLVDSRIDLLSPMRQENHLAEIKKISPEAYPENPVSTAKAIVAKDFLDVTAADIIVANFVGAKELSVGSICEVSWAYALRKPVILVMEKEGNVHDRFFIKEQIEFNHGIHNVEEAAEMVNMLLLPGV